jgi:predicted N-acyltransferase
VAAAFNIISPVALYGRYWGATEFHSGLHFETCYYQAIEFCIANRIAGFEGGAQGEHKLARGLLPVRTVSAHWLARPEFADAVAKFLQREAHGIEHYVDELAEHSPFKHTDPAGA